MTAYSITTRDDYKRCVCDNFGSGAADCATDHNAVPDVPDNNNDDAQSDDNQNDAQPDNNSDGNNNNNQDSQPDNNANDNDSNNASDEVDWDADEVLEEIHENPHYENGQESRTQYQIDRELTWIENKLLLVIQMGIDNNMLNANGELPAQ